MKANDSRPVRAMTLEPLLPVRAGPAGALAASHPHTVSFDGCWALPWALRRSPPWDQLLFWLQCVAAAVAAVTLSRPLPCSPWGCISRRTPPSPLFNPLSRLLPGLWLCACSLQTNRISQISLATGITGEARCGSGGTCKARL